MDSVGWIMLGVFWVVALPAALMLVGIIIHLDGTEPPAQQVKLCLQIRRAGLCNA